MNKKGASPRVTVKNLEFCRLVTSGKSQADAYKAVYQPNCPNQRAAEMGSRMAARPHVKAVIDRLQAQANLKSILTVNDRLEILARDAQTGGNTSADKTARARSIQVYNQLAGDNAPERHEVAGVNGGPIAVAASVATRPMSRRERIDAIVAARKARRAQEDAP